MTEYFNEWRAHLLGWSLNIAVDFDLRLSHWDLFCELRRAKGACQMIPRRRSFADLNLSVGPVSLNVSAIRMAEE